jgi:hypothetical protein
MREADEFYDRYAERLEAEHWGEFVGISEDGIVVLGSSMREVADEIEAVSAGRNFVYRIGERVVGNIR